MGEMTLYNLIKQISEILTPESDLFYEYVLHTSDIHSGWLRTRYCWSNQPFENRDLNIDNYKKVLVTMQTPFNEEDLKEKPLTRAKMQIHYANSDIDIMDEEIDAGLGYCYTYIIDIENKHFYMHKTIISELL